MMADAISPAAASAATAAAAAAAQGVPEGGVLFMALLGAGVSAWVQHSKTFDTTRAWMLGAIGSFAVAAVVGVVAPEVVAAWAPLSEWTAPAMRVSSGIVALAAAASSHFALGFVRSFIRARSGVGVDDGR